MSGQPAVFLDRDGVLNEAIVDGGETRSPRALDEFCLSPGVGDAVQRLRDAGFVPVVITNQPDVARGKLAASDADEMTRVLKTELGIGLVYECRHDNAAGCSCRKPRPGMIFEAAARHELVLPSSWLIGDGWVDLAAARTAGLRAVLLERPWSWLPSSTGEPPPDLTAEHTARSLSGCVDRVLWSTEGAGRCP